MTVYIERRNPLYYGTPLPVLQAEMDTLEQLKEHIEGLNEPVIVGRFKDGLKLTPLCLVDSKRIELDDQIDY